MPTLIERGVAFDACITDPPFNAGKGFDNDNLSEEKFRNFCASFVNELTRLNPTNVLV